MKRIFIVISLFFILFQGYAHSGKARYHAIVDTDGAPDDLRSIAMLLATPNVEVIAITTGDGCLHPESAYRKVRAFLDDFGHQGVPVAAGKSYIVSPPKYRKFTTEISWGEKGKQFSIPELSAVELIIKAINEEDEPVTFIGMGTLTNLAQAIDMDNKIVQQMEQVVWYCDEVNPPAGLNFELDKDAVEKINQLNGKFKVISGNSQVAISPDFIKTLASLNSVYAKKTASIHQQAEITKKNNNKHLKIRNELLVLFLEKPALFKTVSSNYFKTDSVFIHSENNKVQDAIIDVFQSDIEDKSIVFKRFPVDTTLYRDDVAQIAQQVIEKHGLKEWRIGILTNEFHEHLGIYSIVGAKMGLRAREYFNVGLDEMLIKSYAGTNPPRSCLNDGLQVSTGATLGHGTISLSASKNIAPKADFTFKTTTITLSLKDEYYQQIRKDIQKGIALHGKLTPPYWQFVRELALSYWVNWDRFEIFNIEVKE